MGTMVDAIHVGNGSHLELRRLRIPNCASRHVRKPSPRVRLRVAGIFALWPSITLAINSSVSLSTPCPPKQVYKAQQHGASPSCKHMFCERLNIEGKCMGGNFALWPPMTLSINNSVSSFPLPLALHCCLSFIPKTRFLSVVAGPEQS